MQSRPEPERPLRVMGAAHDAGGARALIPVLQYLQRIRHEVLVATSGPAHGIAVAEAPTLMLHAIKDAEAAQAIPAAMNEFAPDIVVTAAGVYNAMEHVARREAAKRGVPCAAVLDSWLNAQERFSRPGANAVESSWPDEVYAWDEHSAQEVAEAGYPATRIQITGPPHLAARKAQAQRHDASTERPPTRSGFKIIFFSDPFETGPDGATYTGPGALVDEQGQSLFGYTSRSILDQLVQRLPAESARGDVTLAIRPHPLEHPAAALDACEAASARGLTAHITDDAPDALILGHHLVLGMMSMPLLEAAAMGRPVRSIQIGLGNRADPCIASAYGYAPLITTTRALDELCREIRAGTVQEVAVSPQELAIDGAIERTAEAVVRLATRPSAPLFRATVQEK